MTLRPFLTLDPLVDAGLVPESEETAVRMVEVKFEDMMTVGIEDDRMIVASKALIGALSKNNAVRI